MISETRMWYGSEVSRHGSERPLTSYQPSSLRRNVWRAGAGGITGFFFFFLPGLKGKTRPTFRILPAMKIYTRTGDSGETGLFGGTRVRKSDPRVAAYGDVDELNACLG